jgi:hypothetical protein
MDVTEKPKCSEVDGRPVHSKGLCQPCYRRMRRNGTLEKKGPKVLTLEAIQQHSEQQGECRVWKNSTDSSGYPRFYVSEGQTLVNVRRWMMQELGHDVEGKQVEDTCDNKACVREDHLVVVDPHTTEKTQAGKNKLRAQERGDVCDSGHPWKPETTYFYPEESAFAGKKVCKICRVNWNRARNGLPPVDAIGPWNRDKTHCLNNHPYDEKNTRRLADGSRSCKPCHRDNQRRLTYGLGPEQYLEMLEQQENCCDICGDEFSETRRPHVDHDHSCCPGNKSCGKCVRALLCATCNQGLGQFKDSVERLRAAIAYLESFQQ